MKGLIKGLKSKTFWGIAIYAITQYLEARGYIQRDTSYLMDTLAVALGLYGARNTQRKA